MVDKSEGKEVCITNQPHLILTLVFPEFAKEEKEWEETRKGGGGGLDNRASGEADFVIN